MEYGSDLFYLLDEKYNGYLEGPLVDDLFGDFGIKFAAGHWCAGEFFDRFCPVGYNSDRDFDNSVPAQIERVAQAGIRGIEFHEANFIDSQRVRDPGKIAEISSALRQHGVV